MELSMIREQAQGGRSNRAAPMAFSYPCGVVACHRTRHRRVTQRGGRRSTAIHRCPVVVGPERVCRRAYTSAHTHFGGLGSLLQWVGVPVNRADMPS